MPDDHSHPPPLASAPLPSLVERLTATIESEILEGKLRPGDRLDEASLTRRFDVSRTPIREALREHDRILRAIQKRDASRAATAMRDHVRILGEDALVLAKGLRM